LKFIVDQIATPDSPIRESATPRLTDMESHRLPDSPRHAQNDPFHGHLLKWLRKSRKHADDDHHDFHDKDHFDQYHQ
jgi:hypothetical protein